MILVHNHRFERNIPRVEAIFSPKFANLFHLVPFYGGGQQNVIRVVETSHHFQGFFAQGYPVFSQIPAHYYIFSADDLLFHPSLNDRNLIETLGLKPGDGYIKYLESIGETGLRWPHLAGGLVALANNNGVNWQPELPSLTDAALAFQKHGLTVGKLGLRHFRRGIKPKQFALLVFYLLLKLRQKSKGPNVRLSSFPYPLASSYSDFVVVPAGALKAFCHYSGVFAAMGLFAEFAIPTALILSCQSIRKEAETSWRGKECWNEEIGKLEDQHKLKLPKLMESFAANQLYVHPVKLSRWS